MNELDRERDSIIFKTLNERASLLYVHVHYLTNNRMQFSSKKFIMRLSFDCLTIPHFD